MTGLEGFVCGALFVIFIWLVDSGLKDYNSSLKYLILRVANFLGKTERRNTK